MAQKVALGVLGAVNPDVSANAPINERRVLEFVAGDVKATDKSKTETMDEVMLDRSQAFT